MTGIGIGMEVAGSDQRSVRPARTGRLTLIAALRRWWEIRRAMTVLAGADIAMLRDLAINRSGIENAVRHGRG